MDFIVARKKDSNLTFRTLKRKDYAWGPESFGSSGKDCNFEVVIRNKDAMLLAYLLYDLKGIGYPIDKAIAKLKEMTEKPDLFFLRGT
jgi:hypothetical protein